MEPSSLAVLPRLDRLDRLLELLEERHSKSRRHEECRRRARVDERCKSMSMALEDVYRKGTLIDRLETLESRVLQLTLDVEEGNISRSSSSTAEERIEVPLDKCDAKSSGKGKRRRGHFKRMGWFSMGC